MRTYFLPPPPPVYQLIQISFFCVNESRCKLKICIIYSYIHDLTWSLIFHIRNLFRNPSGVSASFCLQIVTAKHLTASSIVLNPWVDSPIPNGFQQTAFKALSHSNSSYSTERLKTFTVCLNVQILTFGISQKSVTVLASETLAENYSRQYLSLTCVIPG